MPAHSALFPAAVSIPVTVLFVACLLFLLVCCHLRARWVAQESHAGQDASSPNSRAASDDPGLPLPRKTLSWLEVWVLPPTLYWAKGVSSPSGHWVRRVPFTVQRQPAGHGQNPGSQKSMDGMGPIHQKPIQKERMCQVTNLMDVKFVWYIYWLFFLNVLVKYRHTSP